MNIEINAPKIDVQLKRSKVDVDTGTPVAKEYVERPAYIGPYSVTPGASAQTLVTEGKRMTGDVTVQAIPGENDPVWVSTVNSNVWEPGVYGWEEKS